MSTLPSCLVALFLVASTPVLAQTVNGVVTMPPRVQQTAQTTSGMDSTLQGAPVESGNTDGSTQSMSLDWPTSWLQKPCTPQPDQTQTQQKNVGCPSGYVGTKKVHEIYSRSSSCSGSTLQWTNWADTGQQAGIIYNGCTPACTSSYVQHGSTFKTYNNGCPAGKRGYSTIFYNQSRTVTCVNYRKVFGSWTLGAATYYDYSQCY